MEVFLEQFNNLASRLQPKLFKNVHQIQNKHILKNKKQKSKVNQVAEVKH